MTTLQMRRAGNGRTEPAVQHHCCLRASGKRCSAMLGRHTRRRKQAAVPHRFCRNSRANNPAVSREVANATTPEVSVSRRCSAYRRAPAAAVPSSSAGPRARRAASSPGRSTLWLWNGMPAGLYTATTSRVAFRTRGCCMSGLKFVAGVHVAACAQCNVCGMKAAHCTPPCIST